MNKIEVAKRRGVIIKAVRALLWAYFNGYRPVPGYTVCEKQDDDRLYLAILMER